MSCWLTLRGLQTLPYRVRAHSENALTVANYLAEHPAVERVHYPHHPSHPQHDLARRQMRVGSGLMSIQIKGGRQAALSLAQNLNLFTSATSFGGTHSLIEHRASVEEASTTPDNLLRVSIGLEHADDLIADFDQALRKD
jgi:cystathionine gamma-synthase